MTYEQILPYCLFFKGEPIVPQQYDQKNEGELWFAEKMICEDLCEKITLNKPHKQIAEWVAAYVSKWDPYGFESVMETYFEKAQNQSLKEAIMRIYG